MSVTREKLLTTAFEMFGRSGFHGVGLDRIIDVAGVSKQTFYNHFECKDDLVLAVLEKRHDTQTEMFGKLMLQIGGPTARGKLYAVFDALERWMNEPDWRGCIFMTAAAEFPLHSDPAHRAAAEHTRALQEQLQYLATLAKAANPEKLAEQLVLLIDGAIAYQHTTGSATATGTAKAMAKALLDQSLPPE